MVRFVIVITLGLVGQAFAQQQSLELPEVAVTADCPKANEAEDVRFCDLTPNSETTSISLASAWDWLEPLVGVLWTSDIFSC